MVSMETETLRIGVDEKTGFLTEITANGDESGMNWVQEGSDWGMVDGFDMMLREASDLSNVTEGKHRTLPIGVQIVRRPVNGKLVERYVFFNPTDCDFFCTPDQIGIHFPFRCKMDRVNLPEQMETKCTAHVFCGGDTCWLYGHKISGHGPRVVIHATEGKISEYSIYRDVSRAKSGSDYRGDIVLNPAPFVIPAWGTHTFTFVYEATTLDPETYYREKTDLIMARADRYSLFPGESTALSVSCLDGLKDLRVTVGNRPVKMKIKGTEAVGKWTAGKKYGEVPVKITVNGKETFMRFQILPTVGEILEKRAYFIAQKQQYHRAGSSLDGAYLIYDDETDSLYYDRRGDHNAARERVVMGIIVAKQLQRRYDETLAASLAKYAEFIGREIFDAPTVSVCNDIGKDRTVVRHYNEPWLSIFYRELFRVFRKKEYLGYAADILIRFYEEYGLNEGGNNVEPYETADLLEQEGETARAEKLRALAKGAAKNRFEKLFDRTNVGHETCYQHESANGLSEVLYEAFCRGAGEEYAKEADRAFESGTSYYSFQPDYRMNGISVRHWDCYWFGKRQLFGDLFPHYWSAMAAAMLDARDRARGEDHRAQIRQILLGNLCVYREDGFAANSYLAPFRINFFVPDDVVPYKYFESFGNHCGKTWDAWANDQDWSLYYALQFESYLQF